jgi:hypothetical protein
MNNETPAEQGDFQPLRTWIPLMLLPGMVLARFIPGLVPDGPSMIWMSSAFGPLLIGLLIMVWWLLASRARWYERLLGVAGVALAVGAEQLVAHPSMRGPLLLVMTIPMTIAGFAIGLILWGRQLSDRRTWWALLLAVLGASVSAMVKTDGAWGNFAFGFAWRWKATAEERMLSQRDEREAAGDVPANQGTSVSESQRPVLDASGLLQPEWPGFRGPQRDGAQRGTVFVDDWGVNPPRELWRIPVGPAWSSFAVAGDYLVTQEQRGENEAVVCYDATTGKQVWEASQPSRFFEALGGLGPRATPTIAQGAVYALGAEGGLMKLDAATGTQLWKVDLRKEAGIDPPMWGFSSSPWVGDNLVVLHAGGGGDKGVLAFRTADGSLAWSAAAGKQSYASVQSVTVGGRPLLALLSNEGAHFWEPTTGASVLRYEWPHGGYRALQPQVLDGDRLLIPTGMGTGTRLVQIVSEGGSLRGEEIWTSRDMKPDFNDLVIHDGHAYGFDNSIFACIDLKDGKRKWKGGRYEKGQALLLADSGLIIVTSERGELVLLRANPERHEELAKLTPLQGKTWNHPVVFGDRLVIRNAEEAICYELGVKR